MAQWVKTLAPYDEDLGLNTKDPYEDLVMTALTSNPSTEEPEAGSLLGLSQLTLHSEF